MNADPVNQNSETHVIVAQIMLQCSVNPYGEISCGGMAAECFLP